MKAKKKELGAVAATPLRRASVRNKLKEEQKVVVVVVAAAPPSSRRGARERKKAEEVKEEKVDEEEEDDDDDDKDRKEEALCLSLKKRDKNIMENKAMVRIPKELICSVLSQNSIGNVYECPSLPKTREIIVENWSKFPLGCVTVAKRTPFDSR